ncbi:MAG TPA: BatA domain-containing protein, partial [Gemmataceae bacterium]|nr:BatA domain-containing protein [Gemmataceae bacterium]
MTFVFPVLLGGLLLAGVPILLHLIMRQKPKTLSFPAFRFLVQRQRTNLRKLQLRHLLLLTLRILLIALLCLALGRPRLFNQGLNLSSERPVAAVLVFDTSMSMEYQTSDKLSRLEEAKKRGQEFLNELPSGSRVVILDTADTPGSNRGDWLVSMNQARDRIKTLKPRPASASALQTLEYAYRILGELARSKEDETRRYLPRFVCLFSDRTRACWDPSKRAGAQTAADQVPPSLEGLLEARDNIAPLVSLLKELRGKLPPPPGQDYPENALIDFHEQLSPLLPTLTKADFPPDGKLSVLPENIQRRGRDLLELLQPKDQTPDQKDPDEFRAKLVKNLQGVLRDLSGAQGLFVDVGIDAPVDLAITHLKLPELASGEPQQVFGPDDTIRIRAIVRATGKDMNATLTCKVDTKILPPASTDVPAGAPVTIPFEIDAKELKLGPGPHQVEVRADPLDLLPFNNTRFVTFTIREPRRVLVLTRPEDGGRAGRFIDALLSLHFAVDSKDAREAPKIDARLYKAVYLFEVPAPDARVWEFLYTNVVKEGIGLGIIPAADDTDPKAYNEATAQKVMPGELAGKITHGEDGKKPGAYWKLDDDTIFQHPLMRPFRGWKDADLVKNPSEAFAFWDVKPHAKEEPAVVVSYTDPKKHAALIERRLPPDNGKPGKILLFTTPLDGRAPRWNNYLESKTSMFVVLVGLATNYLAGDTDAPKLNFNAGQEEPVVTLPAVARFAAYTLKGPVFEPVPAPE